jgi:hypothetical protein
MKVFDLEDGGRPLEIFPQNSGGLWTVSLRNSALDNVTALSGFHKEGITTEDKLYDIIFYLAQDHPGGRISSVFLNGSWIEVGAQWIHGQNNEVWKLAHKYGLLSTITSSEGEGKKLIN